MDEAPLRDLDSIRDCLLDPALARLAAELESVAGLTDTERKVLYEAAAKAIRDTLAPKTNIVLILELNAARLTRRLTAPDSQARWKEWVEGAARPEFWDSLAGHYPTLSRRVLRLVENRCAAALTLARRFAADRSSLGELVGGEPGALAEVEFGVGDSHRGGQTVAILRCEGGRVVYKPRSVAVDAALSRLLSRILADQPADTRIRVPDVLERDGYGWTEHVEHRYCADDGELRCYYRNLGHWLAVMRLVGASDLHAENLVAVGPVPTVVDCETLFTPQPPARPSGFGLAMDRAASLVGGSVLGTGLLPNRGLVLGWRGVDSSGMGLLPDEQPVTQIRVLVDVGTDEARVGYALAPLPETANRPSSDPVLGRFWDVAVAEFAWMTERLKRLDRDGELEPLLAGFSDLPIRVVTRSSESYTELARMLWHPVALQDEASARRKAADLLARQAENVPGTPADPAVIEAEVDDLLEGDLPFYSTTPRTGVLTGPRGTSWGTPEDLLAAALRRWREADFELERKVIKSALVGAYLYEGWLPDMERLAPSKVTTNNADRRRRTLAAGVMRELVDSAIRADDGTATWIAPVLNPTGWAVQPLGLDMYAGAFGVAVLLAAYHRETEAGRADPVAETEPLLAEVLRTIRTAEDKLRQDRAAAEVKVRPDHPGGYLGLASRIWGWLLLRRFGVVASDEALSRAVRIAGEIAETVADDTSLDLMRGMAGAAVPLLRLAEVTGNADAEVLARDIGRRLVSAAEVRDGIAFWSTLDQTQPIGGLSHGATGIGWALARLAAATGDEKAGAVAEAAFAFEETLYDPDQRSWRDLRDTGVTAALWCHGAGGIGIVAADLLRRGGDTRRWLDVLGRAAEACWSGSMHWNHTLCHGDLGNWEVLDLAMSAGVGPRGLDRPTLDAGVLGSIEEHGPVSGLARDAVVPSLLPGLGGVAYQLLRMHPECDLPSVLLPDPAEEDRV
ncbi:type 2 lanthipeptide synthetase LanM family protein [Nonomuraea sp. NPDC049480]|uniref:type 2 lanthipeptide synthetase LanM family protein n=1 Tax=Nonomuraea sp. NPDC049480 TaxID=3364353 RepID=UPI0037A6BEDA